jgi:hypothetical protein
MQFLSLWPVQLYEFPLTWCTVAAFDFRAVAHSRCVFVVLAQHVKGRADWHAEMKGSAFTERCLLPHEALCYVFLVLIKRVEKMGGFGEGQQRLQSPNPSRGVFVGK